MSPIEANKALVRRYIEEGLNGKRQVIADLLAPDFRSHGRKPTLNWSGTGRISWERALQELPAYVVEDMVAEGGKVATRVSRGPLHSEVLDKRRRELKTVPQQGVNDALPRRHTTAFIHRIVEGKIVEEWVKEGIRGNWTHY